ncbi:MAG: amidohydrolase [Pyrinomonadaceae bacterium]
MVTVSLDAAYAQADLILLNAKIKTFDDEIPNAEALAVTGNRFSAIGSNSKIRSYIGKNTKIIDADGKRIIPGFNDSHVHFTAIGNIFSSINLSKSSGDKESLEMIAEYLRFIPKGRWIMGGNWTTANWSDNEARIKPLLDQLAPENPIFLYSIDGKTALANAAALRAANISETKKNPPFGEFIRGADGRLNGIITGTAIKYLRAAAPRLNSADTYNVLIAATNYAASLGVTSVQDMQSDNLFELLQRLENEGKLKTRVYDCTPLKDWNMRAKENTKRAQGTAFVRTGCLKAMADGTNETREELFKQVLGADLAGMQVMIHAIGETPIENVLEIYKRIAKETGNYNHRHRVEHSYQIASKSIPDFALSGAIASLQPHLFHGGDPYRTLLASNAKIAFGSDASMISFDPLKGVFDAVTARNNEQISVFEAVKLYTIGSAYAEFQENEKGSISVSKLADFIILSDDIFSINVEFIPKTKVLMTFVDGKEVYRNR